MYYITKKTSDTGIKITNMFTLKQKCFNEVIKLSKKYSFSEWRGQPFCVDSGISSVMFEQEPDKKLWRRLKNSGNEYKPRLTTKEGKALAQEIAKLPVVKRLDFNLCVGVDDPFILVGFEINNPDYYAIQVLEKWDVKMPEDCEQITNIKYIEMFKS